MSNAADERLSRAYELIEADQLVEARAILDTVLAENPDLADAWWLYAHAVSDPAEARRALDNVMRIDPNYPGAAELLQELPAAPAEEAKPLPRISPISTATTPAARADIPAAPSDIPETISGDDLPDLDDDLENGSRRSLMRAIGIAAIILLAIVIVGVILLTQGRPTPTPTATQVSLAVSPTDESSGALSATEAVTEAPLEMETEAAIAQLPTASAETETAPLLPDETEPAGDEAVDQATEMPAVIDVGATVAGDELEATEDAVVGDESEATEAALAIGEPEATEAGVTSSELDVTEAAVAGGELEATEAAASSESEATEAAVESGELEATEAALATIEATEAEPTDIPATATDIPVTPATEDEFAALTTALADFTLPEEPVGTAQTELGETLVASVCSSAGASAREDLPQVMEVLAEQAAVAAGMDAIAARLVNCDTERPILMIAVDQAVAAAYAAGEATEVDYQLAWRPQ